MNRGRRSLVAISLVMAMGPVIGLTATSSGAGEARPSSSSVGAGPIDLSSHAAINRYLRSIGVEPAKATWQVGLRNYAGPDCPGPRWNCESAGQPVVQIASPGGVNKFECREDDCDIVQTGEAGKNEARCFQVRRTNPATLSCDITQESTTGDDNSAFVQQFIDQNGGSDQSAQQTATIMQLTTEEGDNFAHVLQTILQWTKEGQEQTQDGLQELNLDQTSEQGGNTTLINQSQSQKASASGPGTITQDQNATSQGPSACQTVAYGVSPFAEPNICSAVKQTSDLLTGGSNDANVSQSIDQDATALKAEPSDITQVQGSPAGGADIEHEQLGAAPATLLTHQTEHQTLKAPAGASQTQWGPLLKGNEQCCSDMSRTDIDQTSTQSANDDAEQNEVLEASCMTSGDCTIDQRVVQNGETTTNSCGPSTFCEATITCFAFEDEFEIEQENGTCETSSNEVPPELD